MATRNHNDASVDIAVICAMESEAIHLRALLDDAREDQLAVWRRTRGRIGAACVELLVCGVGLLTAAAATSALLASRDRKPAAVLNYGCAGGHRADLALGDVVIGSRTAYVGAMIIRPDGTELHQVFGPAKDHTVSGAFPSDPALLALAADLAAATPLPAWPGSERAPQTHVGAIASSDLWTQHAGRIQAMHASHGSLCDEMEAAAIAQVCAVFGVPFLPIKDISDNQLVEATTLTPQGMITLDHVRDQLGLRAALLTAAVAERVAGNL